MQMSGQCKLIMDGQLDENTQISFNPDCSLLQQLIHTVMRYV